MRTNWSLGCMAIVFVISLSLSGCDGGGGGDGASGDTDTAPPSVASTTPANGASDVAVNISVSATFSEAMDPSTINTSTLTLKDHLNNPVSGTVTYLGTTATFTPVADLAFSTTYTATITVGVMDLARNALANNYAWTFATEAAPAPTPTGLTATPGDRTVTLSWDLDPSLSYNLYWGTSPGVTKNNGNKIAVGPYVQSYVHSNLSGGTTYYYILTGVLGDSESAESLEVSATPPFSISITRYAPDGSFAWQHGVNGTVAGAALATLSDGSFYVTGNFSCTVTFGTGETNQTTLTQPQGCVISTTGGPVEMFVSRYNADGSLAWAKQTQSTNGEVKEPKALTILSDGSLVVVGSFMGSVTFGPGEPTQTALTSAGISDVFVARYASGGSLLWAKRAAGGGYNVPGAEARAVASLSDDSVVLTGSFFLGITFNPGEPGQVTLNTVASCNTNNFDIFIARYTAGGAVSWARRAGGCSWEEGLSIATLPGDATAITGRFRGSATFGPGEGNQTILTSDYTSQQSYDLFLARYASTGDLQWAHSAQSHDVDDMARGICAVAVDGLAVTGSLGGTTTFGAGEANETTLSGYPAFLARYSAADGTLAWTVGIGGDFMPNAVASAPQGAAVVVGTLPTMATLGAGTPAETVVITPYPDILLARYTAAGALDWVKRVDRGPSVGHSVSALSDGSILVLGSKLRTDSFWE